jgi:hypothetical protein
MRHLWLFLHLLGFVMWLGGALGAMAVGLTARRESRDHLGAAARLLAAIYRAVILPGALATVASGLVLMLILYTGPGANGVVSQPMMVMQAAGLIAALITLIVLVPNASRVLRVDPIAQPAQFDALRAKQARLGMISGLFGLVALIAGALSRP